MHFDEILTQHIGEFGRYQKRIYSLVCLMVLTVACHQLAQVFLLAQVDHWCRVPELDDVNCSSWESVDVNGRVITSDKECEKAKLEVYKNNENLEFSKCKRYNLSSNYQSYNPGSRDFRNDTSQEVMVIMENSSATMPCTHGWVYDTSQYTSTVVTDFNLVCKKSDLPNYSTSIYFSGVLAGTFGFGCIADRFGRHPTLFICLFIQLVAGIGIAFAPDFWTFTWLRFILATVNMSIFILAFIIGTEFVGPKWRGFTGMGVEYFFAFGYMLLTILAYFTRDWRTLQLTITVPIALFLLLIPVLPESARWLIAQGQYAKAEKIIKKVAKVNKRDLPATLFGETGDGTSDVEQLHVSHTLSADAVQKSSNTVVDLFKTPELRKETIIITFNMLVNNLVYYGLAMSTSSLGVNDYVAFFISGAVEIPGYTFAWFVMNRWGRRFAICISMLICGVACLVTSAIPDGGGIRTIVAMLAKFGISASFGIIYIYPAECFPTTVRTAGVGLCSMVGRLGGILAPLVLVLSKYWPPLPLLVFGCVSVFAGFLALLLPETLGKKLPETMEEGEELGKTDIFYLPWRRDVPVVT